MNKPLSPGRPQIWIFIAMILLLAGAGLWISRTGSAMYYLNWSQQALEPISLDLNKNGIDESYLLDKHTLIITENNRELWTSPPEWQISSLLVGDANHDGQEELLLVVWKRGSFGKDKPFWVEENDRDLRCHLYMFNLTGEQIRAVWMSSALHRPICSLQLTDQNQDGKNELLIQEGSYSLLSSLIHSYDDTPSLWQWQSWGFVKQGTVKQGDVLSVTLAVANVTERTSPCFTCFTHLGEAYSQEHPALVDYEAYYPG